jgi:UDP-N-acetyl-2-amino-2-deoxyglucuronate dehydrogenase
VVRRRIAVVGLGMAVTPHARSLIDLKDRVEVVWAMSPSEARRAAFAARFPFPATGELEKIVGDPSISAVAVLTPPNTHLELVEKLTRAGKHVLLEKPLEITTARSEAVAAAGAKAGVRIGIVLQHRFKPAAKRLGEILAADGLGKIVSCSTSIPLWRPQSYYDEPGRGTKARDGGGVLISQGIHTLDLMLSLAGPIDEVCGYAATGAVHRMETEDLVCTAVRFRNGAIGTIEATTAAYPGGGERIFFIGTKGTALLSGYGLTVRRIDGTGEDMEPMTPPGGTGADPMDFPHDLHLAVWRDFLDALDEVREPRVPAAEALKVHRLIDALLKAGESNRKVKVANSE